MSRKQSRWIEPSQLESRLFHQTQRIRGKGTKKKFDPHKYFGGWNPWDRMSIEQLQLDIRLQEMMDLESSRNSLSKSVCMSSTSESLDTPSVADEMVTTPKQYCKPEKSSKKTNLKKCCNLQKPINWTLNNYLSPKLNFHIETSPKPKKSVKKWEYFVKGGVKTPKRTIYKSILMKPKKYMSSRDKPNSNFKTMINKEIETLHLSLESPMQWRQDKPKLPIVKIKSTNSAFKNSLLKKPFNRQAIVGHQSLHKIYYLSQVKSKQTSQKQSTFIDTNAWTSIMSTGEKLQKYISK